jgi:glycosyltransferase involved in cell wall biosynthesis
MMASVDVVIPCYNYAKYLPFCVGTVLSQEGVDLRVLIVDDCSPDDTAEVADGLAKADARVTYHRNSKNLGLVGSANVGVKDWATADYTLLLSADDAITPGALLRASRVMDAHCNVGMAYGYAKVFSSHEDVEIPPQGDVNYVVMRGRDYIERCCLHWCGTASPTALVRTSAQHAVGGLHPGFTHTCDMEIWMRLATRYSIAVLDSTQALYRRHASNMSSEVMSTPLSDLRLQLATAEEVILGFANGDPNFAQFLPRMKERLADQAYWMAGLAMERGDIAGEKECFEFARANSPSSSPLHRGRLRYTVKRTLGRNGVNLLKRLSGGGDGQSQRAYDPFEVGALFGWWPVEFGARPLVPAK